ncbi:sterile alpha motif domain-containing protein 9-like [Falco rusticolus]|uniref:sterile alpha motif domain-containing protein 9-like n=1 Tax=Falco rusticolus TaxID=120794 RepID=UPI0018868A3B|nr:sterile alpha motif domain-containing protein 9-like [Falco rusticolus]XP_037239961.1 sterile alpha motif domain-containing protein 9-like [Falco rusticolus]
MLKSMENSNTEENEKSYSYQHIEEWTKEEVKQWAIEVVKIDQKYAEVLFNQDVTGSTLKLVSKADFVEMGIPHGPALQIIYFLKERGILPKGSNQAVEQEGTEQSLDGEGEDGEIAKKECEKEYGSSNCGILQDSKMEPIEDKNPEKSDDKENVSEKPMSSSQHPDGRMCMPYPFDNFSDGTRYTQYNIINVPETGPFNLIDPAHEFKLFTNTQNANEDPMMKFSNEVFRFAAACMNSRTNGTIHFGVHDNPHGKIEGINVTKKEEYVDHLDKNIGKYFRKEYITIAKACIRKPRFVEVLSQNGASSHLFVIEVDVVPRHDICNAKYFCTNTYVFKSDTWKKAVYIRDGASSRNIQNTKEFETFKGTLTTLADSRKKAEEDYNLKLTKPMNEGLKLVSLLTGNWDSLDSSYYDYYILVTNKCHPNQTSHLDFLQEIKWFAVLDFDFESEMNGVFKTYKKNRNAECHFPDYYENKVGSVAEQAKKLKLHEETSWIFCNGRSDFKGSNSLPLDPTSWQRDRAAGVRKMISFLSHKDVKQSGKFLIVFLLLSIVEDSADPLTETFMTFYQELKGLEYMACICIGASTYQRWKDLLNARGISEEALSNKCVSNLTLEMVNGTIVKLKSVTQSSERLLPSVGHSTVLLKKKEDSMAALEILCENECKDTGIEKDADKFQKFLQKHEEEFYRGGKASWWNFYFSSEKYTSDFVRRDSYEKLEQLIVSSSNSVNESPVKIINLYHHPGCGGTTLAMHILWDLRKQFRCAVLKNKSSDFGKQVTTLLTCGANDNTGYLPVLLLVDDFEDQENVYFLQKEIQAAITEKCIRYVTPLVIILNCMRSQNPDEGSTINLLNSVSLKHILSDKEKRAFDQKLKYIEKTHSNFDSFYAFMIMKKNFDAQYIEKVVKNTLHNLNTASKPAQLVCYLTLLNSYVRTSTVSISLCEEFLGISSQEIGCSKDRLIEKMGICSNILIYDKVYEKMRYKGLRIIHPLIASHCLKILKLTYDLPKSEIALRLLKEDVFYQTPLKQEKLIRDIQTLLITRQRKEHGDESDTLFSPLIEAIHKEEKRDNVEDVLKQASARFEQNAYICQALARYFYIKERKFDSALYWAKAAKQRAQHNSYISDTLGQVFKSKLRHYVECKAKSAVLTAEELRYLLEFAENASQAFRESQQQAENADNEQYLHHQRLKRHFQMYNTAGYQGEIETYFYVIDVLWLVPFFSKEVLQCRKNMTKYLSGYGVLKVDNTNTDREMLKVIEHYSSFLCSLRSRLKKAFDFFDDYFMFFKSQTNEKAIVEAKLYEKVQGYFTKYKDVFCDFSFEQLKSKQVLKWSMSQYIEAYRDAVDTSKGGSFSGILEYLHRNADREIEEIVEAYAFLRDEDAQATLKDKQNFILANIVLNCIKPKSAKLYPSKVMTSLLQSILHEVEPTSHCVEPFFLASLLFWPQNRLKLNEDSRKMEAFVRRLSESFKKLYGILHRSRQPLALFYLTKDSGLNRFVHKEKINQLFSSLSEQELNSLWQSGNIWKEQAVQDLLLPLHGRAEDKLIYVDYGSNENFRIPVQPVPSCLLKNGPNIERVSFYLGFSIAGPTAYNIQRLSLKQ